MKSKKLLLPAIILAVAILASAVYSVVSSIAFKPTVTEGEFPFSITYELDGERVTIEDVYEPYLLQLGFVARTPRGRILLKRGYEHIGLTMPENRIEQASLFDNNNENK